MEVSNSNNNNVEVEKAQVIKLVQLPKCNSSKQILTHHHHVYIHGNFISDSKRESYQHVPIVINTLPHGIPVSGVSCGGQWVAIVLQDGQVMTWGENNEGQLGHGDKRGQSSPKLLKHLQGVKIIKSSCGTCHGAFLSEGGSLFTCGAGSYGRLGNGDNKSALYPREVAINEENIEFYKKYLVSTSRSEVNIVAEIDRLLFTDASCGERHTLAICEGNNINGKGLLFSCGDGGNGRLGHGNDEDINQFKMIGEIRNNKGLHQPFFRSISAGYSHSAAISNEGHLYTFGNGGNGRLGHGCNYSEWIPTCVEKLLNMNVLQVKCGDQHTLALTDNGEVFGWGGGQDGQLGPEYLSNQSSPVEIQIFSVKSNDTLADSISCGKNQSLITTNNSYVHGWGKVQSIPIDKNTNIEKDIQPPQKLTSVLRSDGSFDELGKVSHAVCGDGVTIVIAHSVEFSAVAPEEIPPNASTSTSHSQQTQLTKNNSILKLKKGYVEINLQKTLDVNQIPSKEKHYEKLLALEHPKLQKAAAFSFTQPGLKVDDKQEKITLAMNELKVEKNTSEEDRDVVSHAPKQSHKLALKRLVKGCKEWKKKHEAKRNTTTGFKIRSFHRFEKNMKEKIAPPQECTSTTTLTSSPSYAARSLKATSFGATTRENNFVYDRHHEAIPGPGAYTNISPAFSPGFHFNQSPRSRNTLLRKHGKQKSFSVEATNSIDLVKPKPPSFSFGGSSLDFSRVISKRLGGNRPQAPGPGSYM